MASKDIIVIGASAGGFEALKKLVSGLPADLPASIFVVWHLSPDLQETVLPEVLSKTGRLRAKTAVDGELIRRGNIYVAPPDHHLLLEREKMRVTRGPKENRFRPAVDPMFRSAAYSFGSRVVGVILSGNLGDGTAGLWTVKYLGGTAVVQDPLDAEFNGMPNSAMREVKVDYCLPITEIASVLTKLATERAGETPELTMREEEKLKTEIQIAAEHSALEQGVFELGELSPYTCPECHGVMVRLKDGGIMRFRCHTGHAFSADALLAGIAENVEDSIWNTVRVMEENLMLLWQLGENLAENGHKKISETYFAKARETEECINLMRQTAMNQEKLSRDNIRRQTAAE